MPIRHEFSTMSQVKHRDLILQNVPKPIINKDIARYFRYELAIVRDEDEYLPQDWPSEIEVEQLVEKADGLFIYATTTMLFIRGDEWSTPASTEERLSLVLQGENVESSATSQLDDMYILVLTSSILSHCPPKEEAVRSKDFKSIIGCLVVLFDTLDVCSVSRLFDIPQVVIEKRLNSLRSILDVPEDKTKQVRFLHQSFRDFLLSNDRCTNLLFRIDGRLAHSTMLKRCLDLLSRTLKEDICDLKHPGSRVSTIDVNMINKYITGDVRYALRYWVRHLEGSGSFTETEHPLADNGLIHLLSKHSFLFWLEALSLIAALPESIYMISKLRDLTKVEDSPCLSALLYDAYRFILAYRVIIEDVPLQVYSSALLFSPENSLVRKLYINLIPSWISNRPIISEDWSPMLQTLEGHTRSVRVLAFSPDGTLLVSGDDYGWNIILWNVATGTIQQKLGDDFHQIRTLAFSPDGMLIASGDDTVKLWSVATGMIQQTLKGHSNLIEAIDFSPDGTILASASVDGTVKLWDMATGVCQQTLRDDSSAVRAVAFSRDGTLLATGSDSGLVKIWTVATCTVQHTLDGHTKGIVVVIFSPDGAMIASAGMDKTVRLWSVTIGKMQQILGSENEHDEYNQIRGGILGLALSPDGTVLATGSADDMVRLWSIATDMVEQTSDNEYDGIAQILFSPDDTKLVSISSRYVVELWDVDTFNMKQTLEMNGDSIRERVFSSDSTMLAYAFSHRNEIKLWSMATGSLQATLVDEEYGYILNILFSQNGAILASVFDDGTVKLWNMSTFKIQHILKSNLGSLDRAVFSPDGTVLICVYRDGSIKLWSTVTGVLQWTLEYSPQSFTGLVFSADGLTLASAHTVMDDVTFTDETTIKLCSVATGIVQRTLREDMGCVLLAFSSDGSIFACLFDTGVLKLWEMTSYNIIQEAEVDWPIAVKELCFSSDNKYIEAGSTLVRVSKYKDTLQHDVPSCIKEDYGCEWLNWWSESILWLPVDIRPRRSNRVCPSAACRDVYARGRKSGHVSFIRFDLEKIRKMF